MELSEADRLEFNAKRTYDEMLLAGVISLTKEWMLSYSHGDMSKFGDTAKLFYRGLVEMNQRPHEEKPEEHPKATPAQIKASITPDALVSFEDGKPYKSMKRHLTGRGLTPDAYRAKWGLPADYPMTAPSYSATRSRLAKANGLGMKK